MASPRWIAGKAVFTIVTSIMIMPWDTAIAARVRRRRAMGVKDSALLSRPPLTSGGSYGGRRGVGRSGAAQPVGHLAQLVAEVRVGDVDKRVRPLAHGETPQLGCAVLGDHDAGVVAWCRHDR